MRLQVIQFYLSVQKGQLSVWTTIPERRDRHETPYSCKKFLIPKPSRNQVFPLADTSISSGRLYSVCTDVTQSCLLKVCLLTLCLGNLTGTATRSTGTPSLLPPLGLLFSFSESMTVALLGENLIFLLEIHTDPFAVSGKTQASLFPKC